MRIVTVMGMKLDISNLMKNPVLVIYIYCFTYLNFSSINAIALVNNTVRFYELHWYNVVNEGWSTTSRPEMWPFLQLIHLMRNLKFMDIKTNVNR